MTCASRLPALPIGIACAFGIPAVKQNAVAKALAAIQFFNMTLLHSLDLARSRHDGVVLCVKECRSQYEPETNERFSMMNNMSSDRLPGGLHHDWLIRQFVRPGAMSGEIRRQLLRDGLDAPDDAA